jgi:hypothetical protein
VSLQQAAHLGKMSSYVSQPSKTIENKYRKYFKHDGTATMVLL